MKANGKSLLIINQLIKLFPAGVPCVIFISSLTTHHVLLTSPTGQSKSKSLPHLLRVQPLLPVPQHSRVLRVPPCPLSGSLNLSPALSPTRNHHFLISHHPGGHSARQRKSVRAQALRMTSLLHSYRHPALAKSLLVRCGVPPPSVRVPQRASHHDRWPRTLHCTLLTLHKLEYPSLDYLPTVPKYRLHYTHSMPRSHHPLLLLSLVVRSALISLAFYPNRVVFSVMPLRTHRPKQRTLDRDLAASSASLGLSWSSGPSHQSGTDVSLDNVHATPRPELISAFSAAHGRQLMPMTRRQSGFVAPPGSYFFFASCSIFPYLLEYMTPNCLHRFRGPFV